MKRSTVSLGVLVLVAGCASAKADSSPAGLLNQIDGGRSVSQWHTISQLEADCSGTDQQVADELAGGWKASGKGSLSDFARQAVTAASARSGDTCATIIGTLADLIKQGG